MDENRVEGAARDFAGKVQDTVGGMMGDATTQARGKVNQAAGQAQKAYGSTVDGLKDFAVETPITAMLSALGVGIVLGWVLRR